jgi:molecular chaperone GrpE (heat shock protein)
MAQYINYEYDNGKFVKIPKNEIERYMKLPSVKTEDDACWIWCEDNGKIINEEQEELTKKAKDNKITATIHQAKAESTKPRKKVERKTDETKESLISTLAETLESIVDNVQITNIGKIIEFDLKGEHYKLDLIRQRKPKSK